MKNGGIDMFDVKLIDAGDTFSIGGLWQFVWNGRLGFDQVQWSLRDAELSGIELHLNTQVRKWKVNDKSVLMEDGSFVSYDHIVLACGVVPDPQSIPGIENHINICTRDTVPRQKEELKQFLSRAKTEKVTFCLGIGFCPYKCPPAPFEVAFLVDESLRKANVRDNARVVITCPVEWPMPSASSAPFMEACKERQIEFLPNHVMEKLQESTIYYKNGVELNAALIWSVWPIRPPLFVQEALSTAGCVEVDNKVTNTIPNVENAHVIGDCCVVPVGDGLTLPKAGEFAWKAGVSVADALVKINRPADRYGACVAEIGFGKGIALQNNYTEAINNPVDGKYNVVAERREEGGEEAKLDWVNMYLKEIFGTKVAPLSLELANNADSKKPRIGEVHLATTVPSLDPI
jgi:sulfide:quinone oxidoreductase